MIMRNFRIGLLFVLVVAFLMACEPAENLPPEPTSGPGGTGPIGQAVSATEAAAAGYASSVDSAGSTILENIPETLTFSLGGATSQPLSVSVSGSYIYYKGYYWDGLSWVAFFYNGDYASTTTLGQRWIRGTADYPLSIDPTIFTPGEVGNANRFFTVTWVCEPVLGGSFDCNKNKWVIDDFYTVGDYPNEPTTGPSGTPSPSPTYTIPR